LSARLFARPVTIALIPYTPLFRSRGVIEDKDTKNRFASESVYNAIKNDKTVGVISEDKVSGKVELVAPLGILAGIVPTTNPTSRSEEHTSELQSRFDLVCRLLLEK